MRKSRAEAEATRGRIVATAARLFREKGIEGVGIAELMQQAGLTHGGFYKHFASKDALVAEACGHALDEARLGLAKAAGRAPPEKSLEALLANYLSPAHRDHPEQGCAIAALGSEATRGQTPTRQAMATGTDKLIELVAAQLKALPPEKARAAAQGIVAAMVGALLLARTTGDPTQSAALLEDVRTFILRSANSA
ncbi:MAG TPA: TetR/AcrR family transcriptional regulator [Gammaproteobacteria bacterium]|nr:TetR/AcrR family transcriptional regulator [Gammaproteobacteria bacterium]